MNKALLLLALAAAALPLGCEDPAPGAAPAGSQSPVAAAPLKDEDLATPADFDDEAERAITAANYKAEVDSLEKEIDAP